jgi:putative cardiolipin synthase
MVARRGPAAVGPRTAPLPPAQRQHRITDVAGHRVGADGASVAARGFHLRLPTHADCERCLRRAAGAGGRGAANARRQYYVLAEDETGKRFMRALRDAARRGMRVRLLVGDVQTAGEDGMLAELAAEPHAEVRLYNPFPGARDSSAGRWLASLWDFRRVDHRMHNKLFVADNALAVFGGRNIGDPYFMRAAASNFVDLEPGGRATCSRSQSRHQDARGHCFLQKLRPWLPRRLRSGVMFDA